VKNPTKMYSDPRQATESQDQRAIASKQQAEASDRDDDGRYQSMTTSVNINRSRSSLSPGNPNQSYERVEQINEFDNSRIEHKLGMTSSMQSEGEHL